MKTFLKMLLASILGGAILFFVGFIILMSFASLAEKEVVIKDNTILRIDLNNVIKERSDENPFSGFSPFSGMPEQPMGLNKVLRSLENASTDDRIKGVYIKGGVPLTGHATITELRDALEKFRESGKFVYSYSEILTQKGYYLVSESDSVMMNPGGFFEWSGLSASVSYYQNALEKLGVEPVVLRATGNKYKSAVEPFLGQEMSAENRAQLTDIIGSIWGTYTEAISKSRNMDAATLNTLADSMAVSSAAKAFESKMIDAIIYEDEVLNLLAAKTGKDDVKDINFISPSKYADNGPDKKGKYDSDRIAVIIAQGDIGGGDGGEYSIGSDRIAKAIRKARTNKKVKAIVLRVNSPGGSALASEVIWREMMLAREEKPVVASMGDVAASGGYYISCFADTIVAQPTTVTGSIGAFGLFFTAEELLHDKLGINIETVKTNHYSDIGTLDRSLTPKEHQILVNQVDEIYRVFKTRVAEGRGFEMDYVDSIGGGHVYSGTRALQLGLVDVLGGLNTAIEIAHNMAGLGDEYRVVEYPELEDPLMRFIQEMTGEYETKMINEKLGSMAHYFNMMQKVEKMQGYQTRLDFELIIE